MSEPTPPATAPTTGVTRATMNQAAEHQMPDPDNLVVDVSSLPPTEPILLPGYPHTL